MKKIFLSLIMLLLPILGHAEDKGTSDLETAQIATIFNDKSKPNDGDYISLRRPFKNWILECDLDLTNDKRVCRTIQQLMLPNNIRITWKITNSTDGTPFVIVGTNKALENKILIIRSSDTGFEKVLIPDNGLVCDENGCQAAFPLTGITQTGILSASKVTFTTVQKSGLNTQISVSGSIDGLMQALTIAAQNPYISIKKQSDNIDKPKPEKNKSNKK